MSSSPHPKRVHTVLLAAMSLAIFFTVTAVAMPGPLLVDMASALNTSVPVVGQLITVAAATWAITAVVAGPFSDAYGRRPVLVLGACLLSVGCTGVGLAPNLAVATGFSFLLGIGGGMVPPTCIALVGDSFADARKPMSIAILTTAPGVASILGVPLAAVLGDLTGWRFPFVAVGLGLALSALVLVVLLPRHRPPTGRLELVQRLKWVASFPLTWHIAGANLAARITWGVIITFFPAFLIVTYGLGTGETALPVAFVALGATVAPLLGGRIGRMPRRLPITAILLLAAAIPGLGAFLLNGGPWFSACLASSFMLLIVPVTTILSIVCAEMGGTSRGTLAGVISSTNWGGTAAGAAIGGLLVAHTNYGTLSYLLVGAVVISGLLMAFLVTGQAVAQARARFAAGPKATNGG